MVWLESGRELYIRCSKDVVLAVMRTEDDCPPASSSNARHCLRTRDRSHKQSRDRDSYNNPIDRGEMKESEDL